ncbi:hypothetical protein [Hyphomicrobium sp.]|uniref:hypothetical protein n=1 Tax=Hyphomicrobium sp. TaxID=82 RepID=UPI001D286607|nr:hypothetical protein [Hyphomicrobium sp.]MBY0559841.1 hypothetical protein [Hyphomicrobium sp.]
MKIPLPGSDEIEMPSKPCPHCDGTGILARPISFTHAPVDGGEKEEVKLLPGDRCGICVGHGEIGIVDGQWRPIKADPKQVH